MELKFHRDNLIYELIRTASGHTTILDAKAGGLLLRMEVAMKDRSRLIATIVAAFAVLAPVKSAGSQTATGPPCADRARVVDALQAHWGEFLVASGLSTDGRTLEIYVGPTGNWTIIATTPTRTSCLVASGDAWEAVRLEAARVE
jgi:hypothetical protein